MRFLEKLRLKFGKFKKDDKAQFSIPALAMYFVYLVFLVAMFPTIYDQVDQAATIAESKGDSMTAFMIRLIPLIIAVVTISVPFHWAKPYIIREETVE
jgi:cytochrome bd-type quinol oxidase subunit 2